MSLLSMPRQTPKVNPWFIANIVSMATFMEVLDTSIVAVSLRYIAGGLAASYDEATWTLTTYLVANAVILPTSGWLATRIGRKRFYLLCVLLFTIASFFCGIATSLPMLLIARVCQGLGGGGLAPSEQAILADTFPPAKLGQAFALYGVAVVVAPAAGPALGGWITDALSWRWIFFLNIPIGMLSMFLTWHFVPEMESQQQEKPSPRIDFLGFFLVAMGLGCIQVVMDRGQIDDWFGSPMITVFAIVGVVSLALCIIHELTTDDPIVDLPLMKDPSFLVSNIVMFCVGIILFSTTQLIPQMMQDLFAYDATKAGMTLSPGGVVILFLMPLVGWLLKHVQPKYLIAFGFIWSGIALWLWTNLDLRISFKVAVEARCIQAGALAFLFVPLQTVAYSGLPPGKSNAASALINVMRNYGGSVGIAIVQTMIARRSQFHQERLVGQITNANPIFYAQTHGPFARSISSIYNDIGQQIEMLSFIDIFKVLAIISFVSVIAVFFMKRMKPGEESAGH